MYIPKTFKYSLAMLAFSISANAFAWGQNGHRVSGGIAEKYLSSAAKAAVQNILPNEDLAEASTYADEMRSNPAEFWQKQAGPFHYVTVPAGQSFSDVKAPPEGNAVTALAMFTATLKDANASLADKQLALRFIVHIIGDLQQPLHSGNGTDRGGNDVKLNFMYKETNLHRVWDTDLLSSRELSYTEWVARLSSKISPEQEKQWASVDPAVWIAENIEIRDGLYPEKTDVSWDYLYTNIPIVQQRLQMAGVRIAAYLNQVFAK